MIACATRAERHYLGIHACDLCDDEDLDREVVHDGRVIGLGNGEIRVETDGQWYAAPTLVIHYVDAHGYAPPGPFIAGVLARAARTHVVCGAQLDRIGKTIVPMRFDLCVYTLCQLAALLGVPLGTLPERLLEAMTAPANAPRTPLPALDPRVDWIANDILTSFSRRITSDPKLQDLSTRYATIRILEAAADLGLDVRGY